jgi:hypothetical protein
MDWVGEAARCAEMRRILTNILGFSELLADPLLPMEPRQQLEYLEIVVAAGLELNEKIGELVESRRTAQLVSA